MNRLLLHYQARVPGTDEVPAGSYPSLRSRSAKSLRVKDAAIAAEQCNNVSADTVLEQSEAEYDTAGNVIEKRQCRYLDTASRRGGSAAARYL